jgi:hypothetical protein
MTGAGAYLPRSPEQREARIQLQACPGRPVSEAQLKLPYSRRVASKDPSPAGAQKRARWPTT